MNNKIEKSGPIHFYPTDYRDSSICNVVEYCVHVGDRQPLTKTQSVWIISSKQVTIDGKICCDLTEKISQGTWEIVIRGRKHHVIIHSARFE